MSMDTLFDVPATAPLPELQGSEAQVKWAEDVRRGRIRHCREEIARLERLAENHERKGRPPAEIAFEHARLKYARENLAQLERITDAHTWIEAREATVGVLLGLEEG